MQTDTWLLTEVIGNLGVADIDSRLEARVPGMNQGVQEWKGSSGDAIVRTLDMVNVMMFLKSVYIYIYIYLTRCKVAQMCSQIWFRCMILKICFGSLSDFTPTVCLCSYEMVYTKVPVCMIPMTFLVRFQNTRDSCQLSPGANHWWHRVCLPGD